MPLSDHEQIKAMVLVLLWAGTVVDAGTFLYGPCEAESDGVNVRVPVDGIDEGG
jgi:hypothetical protein